MRYDVAIVGGGIIGLATARALLLDRPGLAVLVLEKESRVGEHQSGRNSGVLHSGLYYQPGSLKAELCVRGAEMMVDYCGEHRLPFTRNGKVVIATSPVETTRLDELERRGRANGLAGLRRIGRAGLREIEPHAIGEDALHVPSTGSVDFAAVTRALAVELDGLGAVIETDAALLESAQETGGWRLSHTAGDATAAVLVNCAGLHSDRVARMAGVDPPVQIVPFRGEYLTARPEARGLVKSSIYPVPDPALPFLGIHLTRRFDGVVEAGPNAVPALAREGYRWSTVRPRDLWEAASFRGTWRLARAHWRTGLREAIRSVRKQRFVEGVRKLVPDFTVDDFVGSHSGVRAQAVGPDGRLVDDFVFVGDERSLHVLNAPSPGATASLAIGEHIAGRVAELLPNRRM